MKADLDSLMAAQDIDALLITGPAQHNPPMVYLTGGAHLTRAVLIKARDAEPILFYNPMERDEAASTGLKTKNMAEYRFMELLKEADGDRLKASVKQYQAMLADAGVLGGRLALYGAVEIGPVYSLFSALADSLPDLEVVGELEQPVLLQAMATKEPEEVERIRAVGAITTRVVGHVADFLTAHQARNGVLVQSDGEPLTIGEVKRRINLWLALEGAENPEGTIFAIGRDAGVPHSSGNPADLLRLGETIVFDIFPCEVGGGYFHDFTRTWCLGYAPDEAQALYEDVLAVYQTIMGELKMGELCSIYQSRTCDLFEANGHPTIRNNPQTQEGYVHSLGHGLGLHVHEKPVFGAGATNQDRLDPGVVVTIEPGLYYPDRGMGVRLEDTVWVRPDGEFEILAEYPHDFVLPIQSLD